MKVFTSHENAPGGGCEAVTTIVAAESRMEAVSALRAAKFQGRDIEVVPAEEAHGAVALAEPGVVFWTEWTDDDPTWTACR